MTDEQKPTKPLARRRAVECQTCGDTGLTHSHEEFGAATSTDGIHSEAVYRPCPNGCQRPKEATR